MSKVLVVDDDLASGVLIKDILENDGSKYFSEELKGLFGPPQNREDTPSDFTVTVSTSGNEGIAAAKNGAKTGNPHLLAFVDLTLGDMDGLKVACELRKIIRGIKIVLFSGKDSPDFDANPEVGSLQKSVFYLQKPFASSEVRQYAAVLCDEMKKKMKKEREVDELFSILNSQKSA